MYDGELDDALGYILIEAAKLIKYGLNTRRACGLQLQELEPFSELLIGSLWLGIANLFFQFLSAVYGIVFKVTILKNVLSI